MKKYFLILFLYFSFTLPSDASSIFTHLKKPSFNQTKVFTVWNKKSLSSQSKFFYSSKRDLKKPFPLIKKQLKSRIEKKSISPDERELGALFLGPRAENLDILENFTIEALRDHAFWRRNFHPKDPFHITENLKRSKKFLDSKDALQKHFRLLLADLKRSIPFFSPRYQGHMNWENTLPSIIGHNAAILYNPNNVAFESSPITSPLESFVANDLCKMIGYRTLSDDNIKKDDIISWGHLTCDGTVANIEALWSARNLKFYPLSIQHALQYNTDPDLELAKSITVELSNGEERPLISLDAWSLLNIKSDQILNLPHRIHKLLGGENSNISFSRLFDYFAQFSLQKLGLKRIYDLFPNQNISSPVFVVSGTKHYSFPKAVSLLGLGTENLLNIPVDQDARMDIEKLEETLLKCLNECRPIITVTAIMGTTEESAVDPLKEIIDLRDKFRQKGLEFNIHADAAWGGYFASLLDHNYHFAPPPIIPLSDYVTEQFNCIKFADSVTIDPHKSGYIPYAVGALCYRNSAMKESVTFSAPYIYHEDKKEPTLGIFGVEGSKSVASTAAVYLSHKVIPLNKDGYGKILGQCLFSCKILYARLLDMWRDEEDFIVVPLPRLPTEQEEQPLNNINAQKDFIKKYISRASNKDIKNDETLMRLLKELGPDQNILMYAFNFRLNGRVNSDLALANEFNKQIYKYLSPQNDQDIYAYNLIVSSSALKSKDYGAVLLESFMKRLGIKGDPKQAEINIIRSVVMNPWLTDTEEDGSFVSTIEDELRKAVRYAARTMKIKERDFKDI